ncbi:hypothetical protein C1645_790784 [Glomus cerebriforme]|uniref:Uncharacterized protein n=1 Tax=Glomus cerebriforme TaxID=658196 RepID=A0A397SFQ1_9GLOM|nr:hypothetical protein C1645_790784 [Glomus cerebriforme]
MQGRITKVLNMKIQDILAIIGDASYWYDEKRIKQLLKKGIELNTIKYFMKKLTQNWKS